MTLIVGVKSETRIQLLSDTRITHPDVTQVEEIPGRLKLVALSPHICVGFAGAVNLAIDHIRRTPSADRTSFSEVIAHLRTAPGCDFIVADSRILRQVAVKDGVVQDGDLLWIGDADAWAAFETARPHIPPTQYAGSARPEPGLDLINRVSGAFQTVMNDTSLPTVAGFEMRVGSRVDGFYYLYAAGLSVVNVNESLNESTAGKYTGADAGGYSYTVLTPTQPGHAVVGVHIQQGQLGFVYAPLLHDRPEQVTQIDHNGLLEHVRARYGVELDGLRVGNSGFRTPGPAIPTPGARHTGLLNAWWGRLRDALKSPGRTK